VYGAEAPWRQMVPEEELAQRVDMNADLCVVDGEHFFVRGHIEIPIHGSDEPFAWSVWCSLSRQSFEHMMAHWNDDDRDHAPPYFGWLATALPTYPSTVHLKTLVHSRKPGQVPTVFVEPTDHPLAVEQRDGMSCRRVREIAHVVIGHGGAK
jgi:hypothetical protein